MIFKKKQKPEDIYSEFDRGYMAGVVQSLTAIIFFYEEKDIDVPYGIRDAVLNLLEDK